MVLNIRSLQIAHLGRPPLVKDVSLKIERGEMLCILGPNGTGKTTLLRTLLGVHRPDAGTVHLEGRNVWQLPPRSLARRIAYVPQAATTPAPFSVSDMVLMGRTPHLPAFSSPSANDRRLAYDALDRLGITSLSQSRFTEISGGERQLTLIARAVAQQADILVLDEPTASLDFGNQVRILRILRELAAEGCAIVMASHFPDHALLIGCRVAIFCAGKLIAEGPAGNVLTEDLLSSVYGVPVRLIDLAPGTATQERITVCVPILDQQPQRSL